MFWLRAYLTIHSKVFEQCHAPCTSKTSFVNLIKRRSRCLVVATKSYIVLPHPTLHTFFQWLLKVFSLVVPSLPHFYIVFKYCWTCSRPEYGWNICHWMHPKINQSINHTIKQQIIHGSHSLLFFVGMIKNNSKRLFEQKSHMGNTCQNKINQPSCLQLFIYIYIYI